MASPDAEAASGDTPPLCRAGADVLGLLTARKKQEPRRREWEEEMAGLGERIGTSPDDEEYRGGEGGGMKRPPMPKQPAVSTPSRMWPC